MSELFHVQSSRWYTIADDHLTALYSEIKAFVKAVLNHITKESDTGRTLGDNKACLTRKQARRGRGAFEALSGREAAADYL